MRRNVPDPRQARLLSTRRQFVHGVGGILGGFATGCAAPASRDASDGAPRQGGGAGTGGQSGAGAGQGGAGGGTSGHKQAADRVTIGTTGIVVSRMAIGSGTHGTGGMSDQTRLGMTPFVSLLTYAYSQGITLFETADQYGAHAHVGEAVRQVGRQNAVILTKTHARTAAELDADLARFRMELGVDMIDIVLLHMMTDANWTTEYSGAMEALERAKASGAIRAHGVSCHDIGALRVAAQTPWVDVDLARINPSGIAMDASPELVIAELQKMKAAGKGVIGMKILGEGQLAGQLDMAIGHAVGLDCIDGFTIGFTSNQQFDQVAQKIATV
jgi:aryl-alcohol dehydrogenase-like predicted oxidoreductase